MLQSDMADTFGRSGGRRAAPTVKCMSDVLQTLPRPVRGLFGVLLVGAAAAFYFFRPEVEAWLRPFLAMGAAGVLAAGAWVLALTVWPSREDSEG